LEKFIVDIKMAMIYTCPTCGYTDVKYFEHCPMCEWFIGAYTL